MPLPKRLRNRPASPAGFTLLEILAALVIVVILALLIIPNYSFILSKAQEAICLSRLRNIHAGLGLYLADHGKVWPQGPRPEAADWPEFWVRTLEPFGVPRKDWECPTIRQIMNRAGDESFTLHYVPTLYPDTPDIAYRWPTQPWLIEIADAHGKGPLICFPDGSIKPFSKVLLEQGVR